MSVLIAGVGHLWLRDLSLGPLVVSRLKSLKLPEDVEADDLSHNPIAAFHRISEKRYDKIIFVGAMKRGREKGTVYKYKPGVKLNNEVEIQDRVSESMMGTTNLDDILIISRFYGALPEDTVAIEVEPEDDSWGDELTPAIHGVVDKIVEMVLEEAR